MRKRSRIDFVLRAIIMLLTVVLFNAQGLAMSLTLLSDVFKHGELIPQHYTCDGEDVSPPLAWRGVPTKAQSLVLIMDDPDAPVGMWDHWILFNIPVAATSLAEGAYPLPSGAEEGVNSWGRRGYGGPCPPDKMHRYFFKLYALDTALDLLHGAKKSQIEAAMKGHIVAQTELMGKYDRQR